MENGLLYLFTTIAQCLAGAIALLAAFALYRMQSLAKEMAGLCQLLGIPFNRLSLNREDPTKLEQLRTQGRFGEFITKRQQLVMAWNQSQPNPYPDDESSRSQMARVLEGIEEHAAIQKALRLALIVTGIVMTGSVAATPIAHVIKCYPCIAWGLVCFGIAGFVLCLGLYWRLIRVALRGS
jgi:hypothetical protein